MDIVIQILRFLLRIKYWLIILPVFASLTAIYFTKNLERTYIVNTTIYTGIASGYDLMSSEGQRMDWSAVDNSIDNLINIVKARTTLRKVSLRLYAQNMIYGDSLKDNNYIKAENFRHLVRITPHAVRKLIDKESIDKTIENLEKYEQADSKNFVFGLFNWFHPHYSYNSLSKISVKRLANSDMIEISYSANDPGVTYQTLLLLNREFISQYQELRFGQTNNVISYFRSELSKLGKKLKESEDSLTNYNVVNKDINYEEQTKIVAALSRDLELRYQEILLEFNSSSVLVNELESKLAEQTQMIKNNTEFLTKLSKISKIGTEVARLDPFLSDTIATNFSALSNKREELAKAEQDLKDLTTRVSNNSFTKEGIALSSFVEQWMTEIIKREKAKAELVVMDERSKNLDKQYVHFSPIGTTIKRKEREIDFTERSYLNFLTNLNSALTRQKNLQMTSATLKELNPPIFPINPIPTARKAIVMISFVGTLLFIIGIFILLEVFDRTLRDRYRAERIIGEKVIGVIPRYNSIRNRPFKSEIERISIQYLANSLVPFLHPQNKPDIINFICTDENDIINDLVAKLTDYWTERGLRIKNLTQTELNSDSREYILSSNVSEIYDYENEDIILVEHSPITKNTVPVGLLNEASVNILVVQSNNVWKDIDKLAFNRLRESSKKVPIFIYLVGVSNTSAEEFLGMFPPYTKFRTLSYKLFQFGLTANK